MSKTPLLPVVQKDRAAEEAQEFSRFRCLWDPYTAVDPEKCKPFAQLTVIVDKAVGLVSPDFNGLADPYVTLTLNGDEDKHLRSKTCKRTLAPHWDQAFVIDIYHPISIVTITVFDEEYGESDFADMLGLDDVLAGWVDLRTGAMPFNEWMSGWFDLGNPTHYRDTINGRLEEPHPEGNPGVGRIHLKMHLNVAHPHDELFAMCLPLPDLGHSCHLDLADLVHDVVALSGAMDKIQNDIWADVEWALHHATPIFFLLMLMIWVPTTTIPILTIATPLLLIWLSSEFSSGSKKVPHGLGGGSRKPKKDGEAEGTNGDTKALPSTQEVPNPKDDWKVKTMARNGSTQSLLSNKHTASGKTLPTVSEDEKKAAIVQATPKLSEKEKKELEARKQAEQTEATLKTLVHLMPKHAAKELRKTAADMENLVQIIDGVETLAAIRAGYGDTFLKTVALTGAIPGAILLYIFRDWQELGVQITLTIVVTYNLWQYSLFGRMATGFFYYLLAHWRIRSKFRHSMEDDHSSVEVRTLARAHIKHLGLKAKGKMHDDHVNMHGHAFHLKDFAHSKWCHDCGNFLWGMKHQGFQCQACYRIVCHECAHSDADGAECPGKCKEHEFEVATFHHTHWCDDCDAFLWGTHDQGMKCKHCCKVVCLSCGKKAPTPQKNDKKDVV